MVTGPICIFMIRISDLMFIIATFRVTSVTDSFSNAVTAFCFLLQDNREVDRNEGLKFARKHSMLFIGTLIRGSCGTDLTLVFLNNYSRW